jgi:hypothetical protein
MTRAWLLPVVVALWSSLLVTPVRAQSAPQPSIEECATAYEAGQEMRLDSRLLSARTQFRTCANPACPKMVSQQCTTWLQDVARDIPSVIVTVVDGQSRDVAGATVTLDEKPIPLGEAVDVDPGRHRLRVRAGTRSTEQTFVASESQKQRFLPIKLVESKPRSITLQKAPQPDRKPGKSSLLPPILLGVGGAALATATFFWLSAKADYDDLGDGCRPYCSTSEGDRVARKALIGDVLGVVGIASLGVGTVLLIGENSGSATPSGALLGTHGRF